MKIEYAGGSNLYILATQFDVIQKYGNADAEKPKLNKLGSQEWGKTKSKVRGAVKDIAKDLVKLYAVRQQKEGFVYGPDTVWQKEFEETFPFEETEDQLLAIEAVKKDMESRKIMDRLICGDVGYVRQRLAIRCCVQGSSGGKAGRISGADHDSGAAALSYLCSENEGFSSQSRSALPFSDGGGTEKTLADLKKGLVDILIGTHRVLSSDVEFKNLGMLVIDEEQRFGVTHKER